MHESSRCELREETIAYFLHDFTDSGRLLLGFDSAFQCPVNASLF